MYVKPVEPAEPPSVKDRPVEDVARLLTEANRLFAAWHRAGGMGDDRTWRDFLCANFRLHEVKIKIKGKAVYLWAEADGVDLPISVTTKGTAFFKVNDGSHRRNADRSRRLRVT
jgi:hypothetical protein